MPTPRGTSGQGYFPWGTGNPTFYLCAFVLVAAVGTGVVAFVTGPVVPPITAALASFMVGGLSGVLFGIPRYAASPAEKKLTSEKAVRYEGNTNLEQVSDWLTKIIIGIGLTQFRGIAHVFSSVSNHLAAALESNSVSTDKDEATALLLLTLISGFLFFYLWARVYMPKMFRDSESPQDGDLFIPTDTEETG